jgi:hypothetical protein
MHTLLQIVPKVPGGLDGVGDYALGIARQFRERFGYETVFASFEAAPAPEGFKVVALDQLVDDAANYDRVLLHYVNYGFQNRGIPFRLLSILRTLRSRHRGRLVTIFHELFASGPPWSSAFWLHPVQKQIARSIAHLSDVAIVSNPTMFEQLRTLAPKLPASVHPVPSAWGEPSLSPDEIARRDPHTWIICGGTALIARSLQSFRTVVSKIPDWCRPRQLFVVGGKRGSPVAELLRGFSQMEVSYHPEVSALEASNLLRRCAFGWLDYFYQPTPALNVILKSSVLGAICAHAVVPVLPHRGSLVAIDGDRLPGLFFVSRDMKDFPTDANRPAVAQSTYDWYQVYASARCLSKAVAEMLQ